MGDFRVGERRSEAGSNALVLSALGALGSLGEREAREERERWSHRTLGTMEKRTVHRVVGVCGILLVLLVAYGIFKLALWFLAPIIWKFSGDPFTSQEDKGVHLE